MQGLMWRSYDAWASCNIPSWKPCMAMHPYYYVIRALGGLLYLAAR
jgi:cbb3-type cytochrome oxidase subunit 1